MSCWPDYVVIADPTSLRWQHYLPELRDFATTFQPQPRITVVPWIELIKNDGDLSQWSPSGKFLLRVESPARNAEIFRALLRRGQIELGETPAEWSYDEGWITSPRRLHLGFRRVISNLAQWVSDHPACWTTSDLRDTQSLFDKNFVSERLKENQLATPDSFSPQTAEDVYAGIWQRGWSESYLKLAYGSCASGIAHLRQKLNSRFTAETAMARIGEKFYNSFCVQTVNADEMRAMIQFVVDENATVQQSVEKTQIQGDGFDVRVVVVRHDVVASVFRASPWPMTNLHLGGYRADPEQCRRCMSDRVWADGMEQCRLAAELFQIAALGIDLAFDRRTGQPQIIELNSFGDFLPGWKDESGRTIHRLEIEATAERFRDSVA